MIDAKITVEFDIDGVLCEEKVINDSGDYRNCSPIVENIELLEKLYPYCVIRLYTSRRMADTPVTIEWLVTNKVKYDELLMEKPQADIRIDDRSFNLTLDDVITRNKIVEIVNKKLDK